MATEARLTAQDLLRFGDDGVRRELVNGRIIQMPPAGGVHGKLVSTVVWFLVEYVRRTGAGEVVSSDTGFVLNVPGDPERVRAPDAAFISRDRVAEGRLPESFISGAPDLAVEVLSPSEAMVDVQQKVRDYFDAGARLLWLITPQARTVTVYRADGSARLLRDQDALDGEDVLPGLSFPLLDLFSD
jgi:Uma2 family endonuclease